MSPPVRPMSNRGLETHMTDKPAAGDLDREVRAALDLPVEYDLAGVVHVVVRLIEAHRAPLIRALDEAHDLALTRLAALDGTEETR
jgi:hypothetical protein